MGKRIAGLEFEVQSLRAALQQIADHAPGVTHEWAKHVRHIARQALSRDVP